jgi:hypothetical protein
VEADDKDLGLCSVVVEANGGKGCDDGAHVLFQDDLVPGGAEVVSKGVVICESLDVGSWVE